MDVREWERRNGEYVGDIARDSDLTDDDFIDVLEHLVDHAQTMIDAKKEELDRES